MIHTVNIHEAKTHLSQLIEQVVRGEPVIIAKAGRALVKLTRLAPVAAQVQRLGFMKGEIEVPEDFDTMGSNEIEQLFDGDK
jgi:prevent-host-death family protein